VDFGRIGADLQLVAGIHVPKHTHVVAERTGGAFVAAIDIPFQGRIAARVLDPADRTEPGTHIPTTGMRVIHTARNRWTEAALRDTTVAVITDQTDVEGERTGRFGLSDLSRGATLAWGCTGLRQCTSRGGQPCEARAKSNYF